MTIDEKFRRLNTLIRDCGSLAVAFSGGADSCFLLHTAHEALGDAVIALTVDSVLIPRREIAEAASFCEERKIRHLVLKADVLSLPQVAENPPDRCYHCKRSIFSLLRYSAESEGFSILSDGSNADDKGDYRPGMRALRELGVRSLLTEAGIGKAEIRELSRRSGLSGWGKPSAACLASRIAYGDNLTPEKLSAVEKAEELLHSLGVRQCRVRLHGQLARIEAPPGDFETLLKNENRLLIAETFKALGFMYVSLDLEGFRSGSMNEVLK